MEAKVDVRKLQLLNDRITQTLEALNQVRLSVHGLGHTPWNPQTAWGQQIGLQGGYPQQTGFQGGYPQPFMTGQGIGQGIGPTNPGFYPPMLQHSQPYGPQNLGGGNPQTLGGFNPQTFGVHPLTLQMTGMNPWGQGINPQQTFGQGGLNHTTPDPNEQRLLEVRAVDPFRLSQTFPFISVPVGSGGNIF